MDATVPGAGIGAYLGNLASLAGLPEDRLTVFQRDIADAHLAEELMTDVDAAVHYMNNSYWVQWS